MRKTFLFIIVHLCFINTFAQRIPKALIITGNGNQPTLMENYPPWLHEFHNSEVIEILKGIVDIDTTTNLKDLNNKNLSKYDLLISNSLFLVPESNELEAIYQFVAGGKSYFTLHCGILSLLNWNKYEEFLGGIFIGGPSSEPSKFRVYTTNEEFWGYKYTFRNIQEHPVSKAVEDFDIEDELYYFQPNTSKIEVIARAENHPVMWWHPVGKGKVMSLTLGHDLTAKRNTGYQELLKNGVRWLTGYPLIYPQHTPVISNRSLTYINFLPFSLITGETNNTSVQSIQNPSSIFKLQKADNGQYNLSLDGKTGSEAYTISVSNAKGMVTSKQFNLSVIEDGSGNLASYFGNTITGTTSENDNSIFHVSNIIDGDKSTRWSSHQCEQAFVLLDLKKEYKIKKLIIHWEASYAKQYDLLASLDGENWNKIHSVINGAGGEEELNFTLSNARFLKLDLKQKPPGKRGYSIYEMEVY
ncbi:hypothetical protein DVR12_13980 [Chitinophaga silvatica]|uniref:F5/8 type C domain-containing protein n=1 Tax=Chitinophaga silvatica TaxID=2282649 RepID=A0A3E1Y8M9_9BACT|nr:ThuA domain-containing protein [Chitinophaga silvatica]RFS21765.1 hypothetical protein DVR12_13980 [Chitinophaga silvatica]